MIIKYALKTTKGLVQLASAGVLGALGALLFLSTVSRWREESTYRDAVAAFASGQWADAKRDLAATAKSRSGEAVPLVMLAHLTLLRPDEKDPAGSYARAAQQFEEALGREPGRPSAAIGLCVAKLRQAHAATPAERSNLIEEAARAIERAGSPDPDTTADVKIARAAVAMARGELKDAATLLDEVKELVPARASVASYYWHKGLLALMAREPACIDHLRRAFLFSPGDDAGKGLALALRVACADPSFPDKEGFDLAARCRLALRLADQRTRGGYRYPMSEADRGAVYNAIGLGLVRAGKLEEALGPFDKARGGAIQGIARMNRGATYLLIADAAPEDKRKEPLGRGGTELEMAADLLADDASKTSLRQMLYVNAAILRRESGEDPGRSFGALEKAQKAGLEEGEVERDKAILLDRARQLNAAREHYLKAVKLGHPEAFKIEVRLERIRQILGGK